MASGLAPADAAALAKSMAPANRVERARQVAPAMPAASSRAEASLVVEAAATSRLRARRQAAALRFGMARAQPRQAALSPQPCRLPARSRPASRAPAPSRPGDAGTRESAHPSFANRGRPQRYAGTSSFWIRLAAAINRESKWYIAAIERILHTTIRSTCAFPRELRAFARQPASLQRDCRCGASSAFIFSVATTSSRVMPGSHAECPASGTTTSSASGHASCRSNAVTGGHTTS